jgi:uncharacterized membrane protein YbaN (DUF454 family)
MLRVIVITNTDCLNNVIVYSSLIFIILCIMFTKRNKSFLDRLILNKYYKYKLTLLNSSKAINLKLKIQNYTNIYSSSLSLLSSSSSSASSLITNINQYLIPVSSYLYLVSFLTDYDNHHYHHCLHYH